MTLAVAEALNPNKVTRLWKVEWNPILYPLISKVGSPYPHPPFQHHCLLFIRVIAICLQGGGRSFSQCYRGAPCRPRPNWFFTVWISYNCATVTHFTTQSDSDEWMNQILTVRVCRTRPCTKEPNPVSAPYMNALGLFLNWRKHNNRQ